MATSFSLETIDQRIEALAPSVELFLPEGDGPHPVVIQFHGCGGKKNLQGRWAAGGTGVRMAVVVVDSYAHRRISAARSLRHGVHWPAAVGPRTGRRSLCNAGVGATTGVGRSCARGAGGLEPWRVDRARRNGAAARPRRRARDAAGRHSRRAACGPQWRVHPLSVAGHRRAGSQRGLRIDVPVQAIVGTADSVVGGRNVARVLTGMKTPGQAIKVELFEVATHAFDEIEAQDWRVKYDPDLTARAQGMYAAFLKGLAVN